MCACLCFPVLHLKPHIGLGSVSAYLCCREISMHISHSVYENGERSLFSNFMHFVYISSYVIVLSFWSLFSLDYSVLKQLIMLLITLYREGKRG